jgi:hypothetical protein
MQHKLVDIPCSDPRHQPCPASLIFEGQWSCSASLMQMSSWSGMVLCSTAAWNPVVGCTASGDLRWVIARRRWVEADRLRCALSSTSQGGSMHRGTSWCCAFAVELCPSLFQLCSMLVAELATRGGLKSHAAHFCNQRLVTTKPWGPGGSAYQASQPLQQHLSLCRHHLSPTCLYCRPTKTC